MEESIVLTSTSISAHNNMNMSSGTTTTSLSLDERLQQIHTDLETVRADRAKASADFINERMQHERNLYIAKGKVAKLVKRGRDAGLYNRAIQDLYTNTRPDSSPLSTSSSSIPNNNNNNSSSSSIRAVNSHNQITLMPQQYVLQRQAMLLQMLHKTDIYLNQIKVIQRHSNKVVNYMMCEASVIEAEQKELELELMTKQGEFMNDVFELERKYHQRRQVQKDAIARIRAVVVPEEVPSCGTKFDDISVDTTETMQESFTSLTSPKSKSKGVFTMFGKVLTLY